MEALNTAGRGGRGAVPTIPRPSGSRARGLAGLILLLGLCAAFFIADAVADLTMGVSDGQLVHHLVELAAAAGLIVGMVLLAREVRDMRRREARLAAGLRVAAGAFHDLIEAQFDAWSLTPAEADVALLAIKGLGLAEIAAARGTREGTVKAQLASVYAKAGVGGRLQLMSLFVDLLMEGDAAR